MNKRSIITLFLIFVLVIKADGIKFSYLLQERQMQCFHEPAQKGIRYQIDIKANSPEYNFQVNEHSPIHTDSRADQQYKFFSGFANSDSGITFCINSLTNSPIQLQIEFYHGFYLQTSESINNANEFLQMTRRMQQISNLIKMNYNKYKHQILERQPINNRIQIYATFAILVFLITLAALKIVYLGKVVKVLKNRKII